MYVRVSSVIPEAVDPEDFIDVIKNITFSVVEGNCSCVIMLYNNNIIIITTTIFIVLSS